MPQVSSVCDVSDSQAYADSVFRFCSRGATLCELRDPVSSHASVVLAVAPGGPHEQSGSHHLQRGGDQGQVQGPAQRPVDALGPLQLLVQQVHSCQEAAHRRQRAQTCGEGVRTTVTYIHLLNLFKNNN